MSREFHDLSGQTFGKWTVGRRLQSARNGQTLFECTCSCGYIKPVYSSHLKSGASQGCLPCSKKNGINHSQWKGYGEISGDFWHSIKRGATGEKSSAKARQPIPFNLTLKEAWDLFETQKGSCALSGIPLKMTKLKGARTASLDRIDNTQGYFIGNVQWVHKDINMMKRTYDQAYFITMCKAVASHNGNCEIDFKVK